MNPFSLTKSADMPDELIDSLWVDLKASEIDSKIKSLNPVFVIGGKGSGKTHLLRYYSYQLQHIRFNKNNQTKIEGVIADGYLGVYYRCKGLQADRFSGKGYNEEFWLQLFEYALELTLAHELVYVLMDLFHDVEQGAQIAKDIGRLIDVECNSLVNLENEFSTIRRKLDVAINNCALGRDLCSDESATIRATRGGLIFGIPKIIKKRYPDFKSTIVYLIDELENFSTKHQIYINTLIREKEPEVSVKIGARRYGVKTNKTLSADENLIEGSEKETFLLDDFYRADKHMAGYKEFLGEMLLNRLEQANLLSEVNKKSINVEGMFEKDNPDWSYSKLPEEDNAKERKHFIDLRNKLSKLSQEETNIIIESLKVRQYPVIEKVNIYNFYKICGDYNAVEAASIVALDSKKYIETKDINTLTSKAYDHFKNNLIFQLRYNNRDRCFYNGFSDLVTMSEGMPRNFLQILKRIYEWSNQLAEEFSSIQEGGVYSLEVQRRAIRESSDWFFTDLRECTDRKELEECIGRLAQLLRINHFADMPKECSCITVAVDLSTVNEHAIKMIKMAKEYSFLIEIPEPHKDKNHSSNRIQKLQLNRMLCPRWDLPLKRRGTKQLSKEEAEAIFDLSEVSNRNFNLVRNRWEKETTFELPEGNYQEALF